MERLNRSLCGCGLGLILALTGCRSTKSEVPPGPQYSTDQANAGAGFGSDPSPGGPQTYGAGAQGGASPYSATPGANPYTPGSPSANMSHYAMPASPSASATTGTPEAAFPTATGTSPTTTTAPSVFPDSSASATTGTAEPAAPSAGQTLPNIPQIQSGQPSLLPPAN